MNLDFLDVLSQPTQKHWEQVGTVGTSGIHADLSVPGVVPAFGNSGNKMPVYTAGAGTCSLLFPVCSQVLGEEKPNIYEAVPTVPTVPKENREACNAEAGGQIDGETAKMQMSRWLDTRCTLSHRAWGAEKFLYRDHVAWCHQHWQIPGSRELFCTILSESFHRDAEGWQGLCVAADWPLSARISRGRSSVPWIGTRRIQ